MRDCIRGEAPASAKTESAASRKLKIGGDLQGEPIFCLLVPSDDAASTKDVITRHSCETRDVSVMPIGNSGIAIALQR
jgi:hypothetical protein